MTRSLTGKVALVTGSAKGISAGIAKAMAAAGASVVANFASDRPGAERVVAAIGLYGLIRYSVEQRRRVAEPRGLAARRSQRFVQSRWRSQQTDDRRAQSTETELRTPRVVGGSCAV